MTETAPIVTLNHPLKASKGTVGTPIGGVEVRLAPDGEILDLRLEIYEPPRYFEAFLEGAQLLVSEPDELSPSNPGHEVSL